MARLISLLMFLSLPVFSFSTQEIRGQNTPSAHQQQSQRANLIIQQAQAQFASGRDDEAVQSLESVYDSPSDPDVLLQAGKMLFDQKLYSKAVIPLEEAWKLKRGNYEIGITLALSYYLSRKYAECDTVLTHTEAGSPPSLDYLILKGSDLAQLEKWEAAEQTLNNALHLYPDQAGAYLNLGLYYLERGQKVKAMELIDRGIPLRSKETTLLYCIHSMEKCEGLVPPLEIKSRDTARGQSYSQFARILRNNGRKGSALVVDLLALEKDNQNEDAYSEIGRLCWEFENSDVAQAYLERGLSLFPNSSELHFNMGLLYQSLNQAGNAVRSYQRALELEGPLVPSLHWIQLGTALLSTPKVEQAEAERAFKKALEIDPNSALAYYQLGKLYLQQKESAKAENYLEKAIALDPSLVRAYYQYGLACIRNGKPDKGKEMIEIFNRKRTLRSPQGMMGMQAESVSERILQ